MALIKCEECGNEISDKALACPHCGSPIAKKKYCRHCGGQIDEDCVICPLCGKQVEEIKQNNDRNNIIINNSSSANMAMPYPMYGKPKNKWVALLLCIFTLLGHKIYEGKIGMAILYFLTLGFFGIGWFIDIIILLFKPTTYYV